MIASQSHFHPFTARSARAAELAFAFRHSIDTMDPILSRNFLPAVTVDTDGWLAQEELREAANSLVLLRDADQHDANGPRLAQYTCHDTMSPAYKATFYLPLADLTPATLRAKFAEIVAKSRAAITPATPSR